MCHKDVYTNSAMIAIKASINSATKILVKCVFTLSEVIKYLSPCKLNIEANIAIYATAIATVPNFAGSIRLAR